MKELSVLSDFIFRQTFYIRTIIYNPWADEFCCKCLSLFLCFRNYMHMEPQILLLVSSRVLYQQPRSQDH